MNIKIRERLPDWYLKINPEKDKLMLTNDIDSLMGCSILRQLFDMEIKSFYDFKSIYFADGIERKAINLNNIFDIKYYQKYPFNTVILISWLYNIDIEKWTDEQLQVLLSIDTSFKGYYIDNSHFKKVYTDWLDKLDYRFLEDRILKKMTKKDFAQIQRRYRLSGYIKIGKNGRLKTNIDLKKLNTLFSDIIHIELPQDKFKKGRDFTLKQVNPATETVVPQELIFSMAWIYKNQLKMSLF